MTVRGGGARTPACSDGSRCSSSSPGSRRCSPTRRATTATIIQPGDRVLLIVENDLAFARFLLDAAREKGFKGLVTSLGAGALTLAREYKPDAITLDIYLPDIDGWRVLDRLKNDLRRGTSRCA